MKWWEKSWGLSEDYMLKNVECFTRYVAISPYSDRLKGGIDIFSFSILRIGNAFILSASPSCYVTAL